MNKHIAESDLATPKVTTGPIMGSRKIYARPDAAPELKVPLREIALDASSGEPPFPVYDPSGPYTDPDVALDLEKGLPRTRIEWVRSAAASRHMKAARSSRSTTAMFPASTWRAISPIRRSRCAHLLPPPLRGRAGWGVGRRTLRRGRVHYARLRPRKTSRPPPLTPPHRGEGNTTPSPNWNGPAPA